MVWSEPYGNIGRRAEMCARLLLVEKVTKVTDWFLDSSSACRSSL